MWTTSMEILFVEWEHLCYLGLSMHYQILIMTYCNSVNSLG